MPNMHETKVSALQIKSRRISVRTTPSTVQPYEQIEWTQTEKKSRGEAFFKNLAVASALVLCAVTLRTGSIPPLDSTADVIMTAATDSTLLDTQLGKLSFVSSLFPEAVLVFGESATGTLCMPVSGGVVTHAWSENEPYMAWQTSNHQVLSASDGEVIGIYHGNGDERLIQVMSRDGLSCLYGNLAQVSVQIGDDVASGDAIGSLLKGEDFVFEVRKNGVSVDPASWFAQ